MNSTIEIDRRKFICMSAAGFVLLDNKRKDNGNDNNVKSIYLCLPIFYFIDNRFDLFEDSMNKLEKRLTEKKIECKYEYDGVDFDLGCGCVGIPIRTFRAAEFNKLWKRLLIGYKTNGNPDLRKLINKIGRNCAQVIVEVNYNRYTKHAVELSIYSESNKRKITISLNKELEV